MWATEKYLHRQVVNKATMSVTSFTIELERPNGVYYGGEVVRGKVKLVTSKDIKTRGVRVRFQGLGYMHFHTGSGDNRHDYYGEKVFEEHRYSMFGNYFNTTILDNAGADAYFGAASGDGIMYIPCNENEKLDLIVRVMDYDFGKRDDLLGEILLDASKLVASGAATSFPLTRRGGAEKGEVTLSARIMPMNAIFPASNNGSPPSAGFGQAQGKTYNAVCQLRTHQATGLRKADFIGKNDVYVQAYRAPDGVNSSKALPEPDRTAVLPAGTLEFPFAFPVRADAPGSAELGVGDASFIRYSLYANIDVAWWKDPSVRRMLTILPTRPLPSPALLRGIEYKCTDPMKLSSCCCFPCFSGIGNTTIDAKLGRQAFAPGEKLDFHLSVSNNTSAVLEVKVIILCSVLLQQHYLHGRSNSYEITHTLHTSTVEPRDELQMGYGSANGADPNPAADSASSPLNHSSKSKAIALSVPNVCPSFSGATGLATAVREPITFAYSVIFKVSTPGSCGTSRAVTFPMVICAAPPSAAALQAVHASASSLSAIQQSQPDGGSAFSLVYDTNYVPPATQGNAQSATLVPLGNMVGTYVHQEDSAAVVTAPGYQPYTISYANAAPVQADHTGGAGDAAALSAELNAASSLGGASADPVAALADSLHICADLRSVIRAWATSTSPSAVQGLSPESLQRVLQAISFSMDQVAAAQELAQVIHCTCAHVVVAVNVCSFFKTEIASGMAPCVRDVENKSSFLGLLPSYDREKVEALFVKA